MGAKVSWSTLLYSCWYKSAYQAHPWQKSECTYLWSRLLEEVSHTTNYNWIHKDMDYITLWLWSHGHWWCGPTAVWNRPFQEVPLWNILIHHPQSVLEIHMAVQRMATWIYDQECSWIAPPAILMSKGMIWECSSAKRHFYSLKWSRGGLRLLARCVCLDRQTVSSLGPIPDFYKSPVWS